MPPEFPPFPDSPPLSDLGWDSGFAAAFEPHADGCVPGRVARTDRGGVLTVETAGGSLRAHLAAAHSLEHLIQCPPHLLPVDRLRPTA